MIAGGRIRRKIELVQPIAALARQDWTFEVGVLLGPLLGCHGVLQVPIWSVEGYYLQAEV